MVTTARALKRLWRAAGEGVALRYFFVTGTAMPGILTLTAPRWLGLVKALDRQMSEEGSHLGRSNCVTRYRRVWPPSTTRLVPLI